MKNKKIDPKLNKILKKYLKINDLKNYKKLKFGNQLDSLSLISIISDMTKIMKIKVTVDQISKIKNIEDIISISKK